MTRRRRARTRTRKLKSWSKNHSRTFHPGTKTSGLEFVALLSLVNTGRFCVNTRYRDFSCQLFRRQISALARAPQGCKTLECPRSLRRWPGLFLRARPGNSAADDRFVAEQKEIGFWCG